MKRSAPCVLGIEPDRATFSRRLARPRLTSAQVGPATRLETCAGPAPGGAPTGTTRSGRPHHAPTPSRATQVRGDLLLKRQLVESAARPPWSLSPAGDRGSALVKSLPLVAGPVRWTGRGQGGSVGLPVDVPTWRGADRPSCGVRGAGSARPRGARGGEPGSGRPRRTGGGKTALLECGAVRAADSGVVLAGDARYRNCRVVRASGVQSEMELPFPGAHQLSDAAEPRVGVRNEGGAGRRGFR